MLAVDLAAWLWFRKRPISSLAPHVATRGAAGYALLANVLWGAAAIAAAPAAAQDPAPARHRPGRRRACHPGRLPDLPGADPARLPRPGREDAVAVAQSGRRRGRRARSPLCLVRLSLQRAADHARQLRRRIEVDWAAQRAARFIEEFEQAGRGWFWETTGRGALSYVSEHLAAHLQDQRRAI